MTFKVIEIRDSELNYKDCIPNKKYEGFKFGLLNGWQFELQKPDGTLVYSDISFEEGDPDMFSEDYKNFLREHYMWSFPNAQLTGRIVFRGYGKSVYISEEDDYGVEMI